MVSEPRASSATTWRSRAYVECEAMQWTGDNAEAIRAWIDRAAHQQGFSTPYPASTDQRAHLWVAKAERWVPIEVGDFVIAEPDGSGHYPCERAIFLARWEPGNGSSSATGERS